MLKQTIQNLSGFKQSRLFCLHSCMCVRGCAQVHMHARNQHWIAEEGVRFCLTEEFCSKFLSMPWLHYIPHMTSISPLHNLAGRGERKGEEAHPILPVLVQKCHILPLKVLSVKLTTMALNVIIQSGKQ